MALKRLLVALDFSPVSEKVLDCALTLARRYGAKLFLLACSEGYVIEPAVLKGDWQTSNQNQDLLEMIRLQSHRETEKRMRQFLEDHGGKDLPEHECLIVHGTPYEEIIRAAKRLEVDIIVLGTMGRVGIERLLLGSTAGKVVRLAHCPVMTVRRGE